MAPASRVYCGGGSKPKCRKPCCRRRCRRRSRSPRPSSTAAATANAPPTRSPPVSTRTAFTVTGGDRLGPFPFQNRPTFQQVVDADREVAAVTTVGRASWSASWRAPGKPTSRRFTANRRVRRRRRWRADDEALSRRGRARPLAAGLPPDPGLGAAGQAAGAPDAADRGASEILEFGTLGGYSTIAWRGVCRAGRPG